MKQTLLLALCIAACIIFASCASCKKDSVNKQDNTIVRHDEDRPLCGGYTQYRALDEEDMKLFSEAYKGDIMLEPFEVATQVVAGTNYRFRCRDGKGKVYVVVIFQPLPGQGEAETVSVTEE